MSFCKCLLYWIAVICIITTISADSPDQSSFATSNNETCVKHVYVSRVTDSCAVDYLNLTESNLEDCGGEAVDEEGCTAQGCCWDGSLSEKRCFAKPKNCYVDLRLEKCFRIGGFKGIYFGHTSDGKYCQVDSVVGLSSGEQELLNYVPGYGFPISTGHPVCTSVWTYSVSRAKVSSGDCTVTVHNNTSGFHTFTTPSTTSGEMLFGKVCVIRTGGHAFRFTYAGEDGALVTECRCQIDAWMESEVEQRPVSSEIRTYVHDNEDDSTCAQVLGTILRASWARRIRPLNVVEVNNVITAVKSLTDGENANNITLYDASVLLNSTRQIAEHDFSEKLGHNYANVILKKTTIAMNNLLERLSQIEDDRIRAQVSVVSLDGENRRTKRDSSSSYQLQEKQEDAHVRFDLFQTFEKLTENIALYLEPDANETGPGYMLKVNRSRIDLQLTTANAQNSRNLLRQANHSSSRSYGQENIAVIGLPDDVSQPGNASERADAAGDSVVAIISVFYKYPTSTESDDANATRSQRRVSDYLTVNARRFAGGNVTRLSVPVVFDLLTPARREAAGTPVCSFVDGFRDDGVEMWSDRGCSVVNDTSDEIASCRCNHTTHFAVLMKFQGAEISGDNERILEILSRILGSVSIALLLITISVFVVYRRTLLKDRMLIHFHLILALIGGYLSMLLGSIFIPPQSQTVSAACLMCALTTHFFYLAVFFWSLVEGIYLFYKIVLVFQKRCFERLTKFSPIVGWFVPAVIAGASFAITRMPLPPSADESALIEGNQTMTVESADRYADPQNCFLNTKNGMIWTFVGPVFAIMAVNTLVLAKVTCVIFSSSYNGIRSVELESRSRVSLSLRKSAKGALILMPILGVPWIVGALYNLYESSSLVGATVGAAGAYVQVIIVGAQGILVFFFYCFCNAEVRAAYALAARKRKSVGSLENQSSIRKRSSWMPLLFGRQDSSNDISSFQDRSSEPSPCKRRAQQAYDRRSQLYQQPPQYHTCKFDIATSEL